MKNTVKRTGSEIDFNNLEEVKRYIFEHIKISSVEYEPDEGGGYMAVTFKADQGIPFGFWSGKHDNEGCVTIDIDE